MEKKHFIALALFLLALNGANAFTFKFEIPQGKGEYTWSAGEQAILGSGLNIAPKDLPALEIESSALRSLNQNHSEKYRIILYGIEPSYETVSWDGPKYYTTPLAKIAARYWRGEGFEVKNMKQGYKALNCSPGMLAAAQWLEAYGTEAEPPKKGAGEAVSRCELSDSGMLVFYVTSIEGGKMVIETKTNLDGTPYNVWVPSEEEGAITIHFKIAFRRSAASWEEHTEWLSTLADLEELGLSGTYLNNDVEAPAPEPEPEYTDPELPITYASEGDCAPRLASVSMNGGELFSDDSPNELVFQVPAETQIDLEQENSFSITASVGEDCGAGKIVAFASVYPIFDDDGEPHYPYTMGNEQNREEYMLNFKDAEIPLDFDFSNPIEFSLSPDDAGDYWDEQVLEFGRVFVGLRTEDLIDGEYVPGEWSNVVSVRVKGTVEEPGEEPDSTEAAGGQLPSDTAADALNDLLRDGLYPGGCSPCTSILQCLACIDWKLGSALFGNWAD